MNELALQIDYASNLEQRRLKKETDPPEPIHQQPRGLQVPLDRYETDRSKVDSKSPERKNGIRRLLSIPLNLLAGKLDRLRSEESKQLAANKKKAWNELNDSVGFKFEDRFFSCIEHTEVVFSTIKVSDLLANQRPGKLAEKLDRDVDLLPPTAASVVKFYIHEVPCLKDSGDVDQSKEKAGEGIDLILFGGGATDALSNIGFAAQISDILAKNEALKGKVRRVIVMPHLSGTTKTGYPVNPAMTNDLGPAADIMMTALEQAGVKLSSNICLTGFSAGANQAIMMADRFLDKGFKPKLILLEPAIGSNPNIDLRVAQKGITDPYNYARNLLPENMQISRAQSLAYMIRAMLNSWDTPEGPAGLKLPSQLAMGYLKINPAWMVNEARRSGLEGDTSLAIPNTSALKEDTTKEVRKKLTDFQVPISLVYVVGATTVDPTDSRTKHISERTQSFFERRAASLFPGLKTIVTLIQGGNHYDAMWNIEGLTNALKASLVGG